MMLCTPEPTEKGQQEPDYERVAPGTGKLQEFPCIGQNCRGVGEQNPVTGVLGPETS